MRIHNWRYIFRVLFFFAICFLLPTIAGAEAIATLGAGTKGDAPVAYWNFDEAGGPTAYDSSGNPNDGTLNAGATGSNTTASHMWTPAGKFGGCLEFDGTDDYVTIPSVTAWDWATANYTIEMWVYNTENKESTGQGPLHIGKMEHDSPSQYWSFGTEVNGVVEFYYWNGAQQRVTGTTVVPLNTWTHLTMTLSGTTISLFIDGVIEKEGIVSGTPGTDGSMPLIFGANNNHYFNGSIDEVAIYNRALSTDEIKMAYNAGAAALLGGGTSASYDPWGGDPPVAWWSLDENTGITAYDRSGSGNDGTIYAGFAGGTETTYSEGGVTYKVHTFTSSGTFTANGAGNVEVLVVAGGGGGGSSAYASGGGGGGGAGGLVYNASFSVSSGQHNVVIGTGGAPGAAGARESGSNGTDSTFSTIAATGGGGGATTGINGFAGGSGGGAGYNGYSTVYYGGSGVAGQGNDGGDTSLLSWAGGAGGGGAGGVGGDNKINHAGGDGGIGLAYSISGSSVTYAAGGGGGANSPAPSIANTGDGGDAAYAVGTAYAGGSGIVIIRYALTWAHGKYGPALSFDGSGDYVDVGKGSSLNNITNLTLSAWVKPRSFTSSYRTGIVARRSGAGLNFDISGSLEGCGAGKVGVMEGGASNVYGNTILSTNQMYFVTATLEGTAVKLYVDGVLDGSGSLTWTWSSDVDIHIGGISNISGYYFDGIIDEVKIYDYARTQAQIAWDYNKGKPVGWWKMDEATSGSAVGSGNIKDSSGQGNHGSGAGTNIAWTTGRYGGALTFNGTDDYVDCGNDASLSGMSELTIEAWIYLDSDKDQGIVSKGYVSGYCANGDYTIFVYTKKIYFWTSRGSSGYSNTVLDLGKWYHIVSVYNGATLRNYINGVQDSVTGAGTGNIGTSACDLYIGKYYGDAQTFRGLIDDVRIYNYARTTDQIMQDYLEGAAAHLGD